MSIFKKFYLNKYDVQIADIYNTLGILQGEIKNYDKEIEYYEKSYRIKTKIFGENHS